MAAAPSTFPLLPFEGIMPQLGDEVFVAPGATVVGKVTIGDQSSVWFGCVLRGDVGTITIGARSNIQELTMVHMSQGISDAVIGDDVTVGHRVILHGCTVGHRTLVGMGAILLDNVVVGEDCVIGAGSLLTTRMVVPPRSLVLGSPAKVVRQVTDAELQTSREITARYVGLAGTYRERT